MQVNGGRIGGSGVGGRRCTAIQLKRSLVSAGVMFLSFATGGRAGAPPVERSFAASTAYVLENLWVASLPAGRRERRIRIRRRKLWALEVRAAVAAKLHGRAVRRLTCPLRKCYARFD